MLHRALSQIVAIGLSLGLASAGVAADSAVQIDAKLKAREEVAWLIKDSTSKDGDLAVLFSARLNGAEPAKFPYLVHGTVAPAETDAVNGFDEKTDKVEDRVTMQNLVVSLKQKRVLTRLSLGKKEDQMVYFPGRNHANLEVVWTPTQGGWQLGLLSFGRNWDNDAVLVLATDGESVRQADIKPELEAKAKAFLTTALKGKKGLDVSHYAILFSEPKLANSGAADSAKITLTFDAQVPHADEDVPLVTGTMTVLVERTPDAVSAKVLNLRRTKNSLD